MSHQLSARERQAIRSIVDNIPVIRNLLIDTESADALCSFLRSLYLPDTPPMPHLSDAEKSTAKSLTSKVAGTDLGKQFAKIDETAFRRYMEGGGD